MSRPVCHSRLSQTVCDTGVCGTVSVMTGSYIAKPRHIPHIRPHYRENTVSRSICEVKHGQDRLVLWWGTTWEVRLLYIFPFFAAPGAGARLFWGVFRKPGCCVSFPPVFATPGAGARLFWGLSGSPVAVYSIFFFLFLLFAHGAVRAVQQLG